MANRKHKEHQRQLNLDTFSDGIKGKVLEAVSISNELECRYISLELRIRRNWTLHCRVNVADSWRGTHL